MEPVSETIRDLGYGGQAKNYHQTHSRPSPMPSRPKEKPLPDVPLIAPQRTPDEIRGADHDSVKKHLIGHKKSRLEWREYREKHVNADMQEILAEILTECRVNGFVNPHVVHDRVVFDQMVKTIIRYGGKAFYKKYPWPLTVADMRAREAVVDWYGDETGRE